MGAYATGSPLLQPEGVSGTVTLAAANTPYNLLALIQAQLDPNCSGAGQEVNIQTDASAGVYVGQPSPVSGLLSSTNYGYYLAPASGTASPQGASRTYRSSFPGNNSPVGRLYVLSTAANTTIHIEVN